MSLDLIEQYTATLTREFTRRTPADARPRTVYDVTDKGEDVAEFIIPNPAEPRHAVSLTVSVGRGQAAQGMLRFGQAEVASALSAEDAVAAISEVLDGNIVAVIRYRNRDAFDSRRPAASGQMQWLYQMPDDADRLSRMVARLKTKANLLDRIGGTLIGVFEVYAWDQREVIER